MVGYVIALDTAFGNNGNVLNEEERTSFD